MDSLTGNRQKMHKRQTQSTSTDTPQPKRQKTTPTSPQLDQFEAKLEEVRSEVKEVRSEMVEMHKEMCSKLEKAVGEKKAETSNKTIKFVSQSKEVEELDTFISTTCYEELKRKFYSIKKNFTRNGINTIIVAGPKGCGKTTSVKKLHKQLTDDSIKAACLDISKVDQGTLRTVLDELHTEEIEVLLVDNAQTAGDFYDMVDFPFVVAAFSPGSVTGKLVRQFRKVRGDGQYMTVHFSPLDRDHSKELLQAHGYTIQPDSDSDSDFDCNSNAKFLTQKQFEQLHYRTGGVPRYLVFYITMTKDDASALMDEELKLKFFQLRDATGWDMKKACDEMKKFALNRGTVVSVIDEVTLHGIGYIDCKSRGHLVSPRYIHMVLEHEQLLLDDSVTWWKLEELTLFRLKFKKGNTAVNSADECIAIPTPTSQFAQTDIGEMPNILGILSVLYP